jgi:hypothetical protein
MAKLTPSNCSMPAKTIPARAPFSSSRGPPLLPGLTGTSTCIASPTCRNRRPVAETIPDVMVFSRPPGEPIAKMRSPGRADPAADPENT